MEEYTVRLMDLPTTVDGLVVEKDDYQTFILNARMTREKNIESYVHEEWHIDNEDLYKDNVQAIEQAAHNHTKMMKHNNLC